VVFYPNPRTPLDVVKTMQELERALCLGCRKELGL
jgi:hypothetical protein